MANFKWKWQDTLIVMLGLLSLGYALVNYGKLPDQLPSHIGITGKVDQYWSKGSVVGLFSFLGLIFPFAMQFIRNFDPKSENYNKFQGAYKMVRLAVAVVCDGALVLSVNHGLNEQFAAGKWATAGLGLMLAVIGNFMPQIRDNYFIGIRTPWTLANPVVWQRTHRFSGKIWVAGGVLLALAAFMPGALSPGTVIAALIIIALVPVVYSWMISRGAKA
ncbi:SdpI family protein [Paenibacillus sp. FSL K6-1096]|uniref:SdpI family protein n=1 Tax=Paenibacillus sp. FSL K6-1096 TaxID=2921460 RepID=UPI0030EF3A0A